ncbi:small integral membrane protein 19 isoform X1 [Molossus molossus]|uniref:small integral membrane protein 19 isoform X1 n=1 Tax=Molossus molossus TaxID=27622 RepID=UPI0017466CC6|nr:small integral membrane protein 19 isoform X1 [Molossus molossus]
MGRQEMTKAEVVQVRAATGSRESGPDSGGNGPEPPDRLVACRLRSEQHWHICSRRKKSSVGIYHLLSGTGTEFCERSKPDINLAQIHSGIRKQLLSTTFGQQGKLDKAPDVFQLHREACGRTLL